MLECEAGTMFCHYHEHFNCKGAVWSLEDWVTVQTLAELIPTSMCHYPFHDYTNYVFMVYEWYHF